MKKKTRINKPMVKNIVLSGLITLGLSLSTSTHAKDEIEETALAVALPIIKAKAESGDSEYQLKLGLMYLADWVERDKDKAIYWLEKSAKTNPQAQYVLGNLYLENDTPKDLQVTFKPNYDKAIYWLEKSATDNLEYQLLLANGYKNGYLGLKQDGEKALQWMLKAGENNAYGALKQLPDMYRYGWGTKENFVEAFKWQKRLVELQTPIAKVLRNGEDERTLSNMYYCGMGVEKNFAEAEKWQKIASDMGKEKRPDLTADFCYDVGEYTLAKELFEQSYSEDSYGSSAYYLGLMYYLGKGVEKDYSKAFEWYSKGAEQGDSDSQINLAGLYTLGLGVEVNYQKAMQLFQTLAKQENGLAINNIGYLYENGYGVPVDYVKAKTYYLKAVEKGEPLGYEGMGQLYKLGRGVEQNLDTSKEWYGKACDMGVQEACDAVKELSE